MRQRPTPIGPGLPRDSASLILDYLPKHYPKPEAPIERLVSEAGRLLIAQEQARYDMVLTLKMLWEKQMEKKD